MRREDTVNRSRWIAALVAAAVVVVGVAVFAMVRDDGHMDAMATGDGHRQAHMGRAGGPGWTGPVMDMGGMPGMGVGEGGAMAMSEEAFITMMIPHHQMAVDMARIELRRGTDAETRALARRVIADQEEEITQMAGWYREWFGTDVPSMPMSGAMGMMGMGMDMSELESASDPDRVFLRAMIPHHAGALLMADMALTASPRAELTGLARRIVAAQSAEIGQMQEMRERIAPPLG
jgi:uncharacterized protein (DUF305 family)